jgi:hypothetical protein
MFNATNIIILEYSLSEDSFHISDAIEVIENNHKAIIKNIKKDYLVIGMFKTYTEAVAYSEVFRKNYLKPVLPNV